MFSDFSRYKTDSGFKYCSQSQKSMGVFFSPIEARKIPKWIIFSQSSKLNRHKSTCIKKSNTYSKFKFDVVFLVLVFDIFSLWFHMTLKELFIPIRKQRFFPNWTGMGSLLKKVKKNHLCCNLLLGMLFRDCTQPLI